MTSQVKCTYRVNGIGVVHDYIPICPQKDKKEIPISEFCVERDSTCPSCGVAAVPLLHTDFFLPCQCPFFIRSEIVSYYGLMSIADDYNKQLLRGERQLRLGGFKGPVIDPRGFGMYHEVPDTGKSFHVSFWLLHLDKLKERTGPPDILNLVTRGSEETWIPADEGSRVFIYAESVES